MECNMSRPLSLLLAAALAASTVAASTIPASAETNRSGEWNIEHWRGDIDGSRDWRWGHRRHHHPGFAFGGPGFSFSIGVPYPPRYSYYRPRPARDCYREWDGSLYCRAY